MVSDLFAARFTAMLYGVLSLGMGFALQHMKGTFVQIIFSVLGTTLGPIVGMYFLGATVPSAGPIVSGFHSI